MKQKKLSSGFIRRVRRLPPLNLSMMKKSAAEEGRNSDSDSDVSSEAEKKAAAETISAEKAVDPKGPMNCY